MFLLHFDDSLVFAEQQAFKQVHLGLRAFPADGQQGDTAEKTHPCCVFCPLEVFLVESRVVSLHKSTDGVGGVVHLGGLALGGIIGVHAVAEEHFRQVVELRVRNQPAPQGVVLGGGEAFLIGDAVLLQHAAPHHGGRLYTGAGRHSCRRAGERRVSSAARRPVL